MMWLYGVLGVYVLGVVFLLGLIFDEREGMSWGEWAMIFGWPLSFMYVAVWGRRRSRRWYCWLVGHDDEEVTAGIYTDGRKRTADQCKRCWRETNEQDVEEREEL